MPSSIDIDDLTMSLPVSGYDSQSLPGTLERRNGVRRSSEDSSSSDDTDGNMVSVSKGLSRGNR